MFGITLVVWKLRPYESSRTLGYEIYLCIWVQRIHGWCVCARACVRVCMIVCMCACMVVWTRAHKHEHYMFVHACSILHSFFFFFNNLPKEVFLSGYFPHRAPLDSFFYYFFFFTGIKEVEPPPTANTGWWQTSQCARTHASQNVLLWPDPGSGPRLSEKLHMHAGRCSLAFGGFLRARVGTHQSGPERVAFNFGPNKRTARKVGPSWWRSADRRGTAIRTCHRRRGERRASSRLLLRGRATRRRGGLRRLAGCLRFALGSVEIVEERVVLRRRWHGRTSHPPHRTTHEDEEKRILSAAWTLSFLRALMSKKFFCTRRQAQLPRFRWSQRAVTRRVSRQLFNDVIRAMWGECAKTWQKSGNFRD